MPGSARNKRIVFCFDGTWNQLNVDNPTNVVLLSQMIRPVARNGTPQIVYYDEGIGTDKTWLGRMIDGALGRGMLTIMREAYRFLIFNYQPGDEIYAFGFSRGAFTARSFIGFIRHAGILDAAKATRIEEAIEIYRTAPAGETGEESEAGKDFRARHCQGSCVSEADRDHRIRNIPDFDPDKAPIIDIRHVGVWDTVRALGAPDFLPFSKLFNRKYGYHDAVLSSKIGSARHAVALDERRLTFRPTLFGRAKVAELNARKQEPDGRQFEPWEVPYQEQWFPGVHGAIGGGGERRGLSDAALLWILEGAQRAGLDLRTAADSPAYKVAPNSGDDIHNDDQTMVKRLLGGFHSLFRVAREGPGQPDEIALATYQRWTAGDLGQAPRYGPRSLRNAGVLLADWPCRGRIETKSGEGAPEYEEYVIAKGDWLSKLAGQRLGDPKRWREIYEMNCDRIGDPDHIPIGLPIRLPASP